MTNEDSNKYIHVEIMGHPNCNHSNISSKDEKLSVCDICGYEFTEDDDWVIPDYCSDLNAVALVEAKVIETVGLTEYGLQLANLDGVLPIVTCDWSDCARIATATALQRATACVKAWEGKDAR